MLFIFFTTMVLLGSSQESFAVEQAVEKIMSRCINPVQFEKLCQFYSADTKGDGIRTFRARDYKQTYIDSLVMDNIAITINQLHQLLETIGVAGAARCNYKVNEGSIILDSVSSLINHAAQSRKLSQCQKICLALCASAHTLQYDFDDSVDLVTPCSSFVRARGDCKHFSVLGQYFLQSIGVQSKIATSRMHVYLKVNLNQKWYYVSPQDPDCNFYSDQ